MSNPPHTGLFTAARGSMHVEAQATAQGLMSPQPFLHLRVGNGLGDSRSKEPAIMDHLPGPVSLPCELGRLGPPRQASPDKARSSLRPALSMMRAATAVNRTWIMPTVTEARLLSWGEGRS